MMCVSASKSLTLSSLGHGIFHMLALGTAGGWSSLIAVLSLRCPESGSLQTTQWSSRGFLDSSTLSRHESDSLVPLPSSSTLHHPHFLLLWPSRAFVVHCSVGLQHSSKIGSGCKSLFVCGSVGDDFNGGGICPVDWIHLLPVGVRTIVPLFVWCFQFFAFPLDPMQRVTMHPYFTPINFDGDQTWPVDSRFTFSRYELELMYLHLFAAHNFFCLPPDLAILITLHPHLTPIWLRGS
jgi:hypothetical protein